MVRYGATRRSISSVPVPSAFRYDFTTLVDGTHQVTWTEVPLFQTVVEQGEMILGEYTVESALGITAALTTMEKKKGAMMAKSDVSLMSVELIKKNVKRLPKGCG